MADDDLETLMTARAALTTQRLSFDRLGRLVASDEPLGWSPAGHLKLEDAAPASGSHSGENRKAPRRPNPLSVCPKRY